HGRLNHIAERHQVITDHRRRCYRHSPHSPQAGRYPAGHAARRGWLLPSMRWLFPVRADRAAAAARENRAAAQRARRRPATLEDRHHGCMDAGSYSVAFPRRWWYPVARSSEVGRRPLAVTLMDSPLVVFRDARGAPAVLLDRCEHRNYPLSLGRVTGDGVLECGYHGWSYDGSGHCVRVPGLRG